MKYPIRVTVVIAMLLVALTADLHAQGTAFTYQGRLTASGALANGTFDITFTLFNAPSAGGTVGTSNVANDLSISNGLFTVTLDFGSASFDGNDRWLQIAVRPGASTGVYTDVTPRQPITATPYAVAAGNVTGPIHGSAIVNGTISGAKLAAGAVGAAQLASNSITAGQLAPGAAAANLQASGQSGVASGGMILSSNSNDGNLLNVGYINLGRVALGGIWEPRNGGVPSAGRRGHTAVWTGREMIIWGGATNNGPPQYRDLLPIDGARYDPAASRSTTTTTIDAPGGRTNHTAIWTGTEMIVWGGQAGGTLNTGGRYDPASNRWTAITTNDAPAPRANHTAVWTGSEMLVWGGFDGTDFLKDGMRYNPASNGWTAIKTNTAIPARRQHTAVWTGTEMIIWGSFQQGGWRYTPATDTWTAIPPTGAPSVDGDHTAVWTGSEMIVWGGGAFGGRYNPAANRWAAVSPIGEPSERAGHTAIWTGSEMMVWGGGSGGIPLDSGGRYDPATDGWTTITPAPPARTGHTAVWTGHEMIIWGGLHSGRYLNDAHSYQPARMLYLYQKP